jgi:hypothetical protein
MGQVEGAKATAVDALSITFDQGGFLLVEIFVAISI